MTSESARCPHVLPSFPILLLIFWRAGEHAVQDGDAFGGRMDVEHDLPAALGAARRLRRSRPDARRVVAVVPAGGFRPIVGVKVNLMSSPVPEPGGVPPLAIGELAKLA
jgi:hypothetical protein